MLIIRNQTNPLSYAFTVMVGKKNIECRVLAINKGEIVKRIIYQNPDADFLFCVGDDKVSRFPVGHVWACF
jgi:trehalose-6-phosphatase